MGVSYALIYPPSSFTATDELVEVCKVVSRYNGIYITHIRSEAGRLLESLEEAIEIGTRAKLPVEIYHLKAAGKPNWGKMSAVIEASQLSAMLPSRRPIGTLTRVLAAIASGSTSESAKS